MKVLISSDMVKGKIITYGLDRMGNLDVTDQNGEKPKSFNPDLYFKHSVGITASDDAIPEEIKFRAKNVAAKYIDSQPFHQSQKVVESNVDFAIFSLFVQISEELIRELLSYGGEVEVIAPTNLRDELKERVDEMYRIYKG